MTTPQFKVKQPKTEQDFERYHQLRFDVLRAPWQQPKGSEVDDLEGQSVHRMIVDENENVVAVGRFHKVSCFVAQIRFMAVSNEHQGLGLGRMMLDALEQQARLQGVELIELNARDVALEFYKSCGYQYVALAHLLYDEIQHHKMSKNLSPIENNCTQFLSDLKQVWHNTIPVSKHMLIHPASLQDNRFTVCANREANINLHNTMFAGSIYTLATLTGWGWVHMLLKLNELDGDIVLADADIRYHKPLHGQPLAITEEELTSGNIKVVNKGRKARVMVQVHVHDGDQVVATFNGKYVIIPNLGNV
ncbi:bifunctional GNAT family N-acetyltransferase/hotdog fold thioesterase [Thalassotalea crassostreae]|uniref:bifunctional GNAT family N-acetyltransferase/hotdog fold thioesterase n=1 Tax=Thalassotalea crassostreae TaxID=1763536 RepID=UPI000838A248|nr:bifunctional GNAT family N-acetyltransferase/hotdog fold thioesterase [Thalassotalea crassostreae]